MDSVFVRHEPCPECNSRDNLGIWDDGHKFCFGCGYFEGGEAQTTEQLTKRLKQQEEKFPDASINLPSDNTRTLPEITLVWLRKYGLTNKEIYQQNSFSWSDKYESLIYSVFDPVGNLVMYQTRYFGNDDAVSRFITRGFPEDVFHILGSNNNCITVVEDIISAIKVGRHTSAMPLWGSNLSTKRISRLAQMYPNLNIWLDKDKQMYSVMGRQRAAPFFNRARSIISANDPKTYNDLSVIEFLAG